jgi:hypothetical protein
VVVIAGSLLFAYAMTPPTDSATTADTETSPGPLLVVPEVPLGTFGILLAFLAALIITQLLKHNFVVKF